VLIYMSSLCVFLSVWISPHNKHNIKRLREDMDLIMFSCKKTISHSFAALTREKLFLLLEHKIHISSQPSIILYLFYDSCFRLFWICCGYHNTSFNNVVNRLIIMKYEIFHTINLNISAIFYGSSLFTLLIMNVERYIELTYPYSHEGLSQESDSLPYFFFSKY
jgi:hypothetical protein